MKKIILIDGNAVIHRAFHALPPFKTSKGEQVNAVYGFSSILLNLLNYEKPDYIAVSFDLKGPTFRHKEYKEYKATRKKAPDELYSQIPRIKDIVKAFEIPIYEIEGFEADDVLGTLAKQIEKKDDIKTYIFTGDMDTLQLVNEKTMVLSPARGIKEPIVYNVQKVLSKYGLKPSQIPDMKGLQGDSSDNIKGVAGVGAKTAKTLLQKYENIENIYDNLGEITGRVHDNLAKDKESAFFSRKLATIVTDVPIELDLEGCHTHEYDKNKVLTLFSELEFKTLMGRLTKFNNHSQEKKIEEDKTQQSLF
ncbi:MAG: DNA polymerase I, partial [Nitrospirae bacterium]|nr:DNA polymerase I [Nitrospirota bacterium]